MKASDFAPSEIFDYEATVELWGNRDVHMGVDCCGKSLEKLLPRIDKLIQLLEVSRDRIARALVAADYISLAEDWASSAEEAESKGCYIMEDGTEVQLPISEQDFTESLILDCLSVDCDEKTGEASAGIYLVCQPDYFAGHCIEIEVDSKGNIEVLGIAG